MKFAIPLLIACVAIPWAVMHWQPKDACDQATLNRIRADITNLAKQPPTAATVAALDTITARANRVTNELCK